MDMTSIYPHITRGTRLGGIEKVLGEGLLLLTDTVAVWVHGVHIYAYVTINIT